MSNKCGVFLESVSSVCLILFLGGCSTTMHLNYAKPPIKEMDKGTVCLVVDDQRLPDRGGDDPTRVGTIRNTFGMPFPLRTTPNREPSKVIKELVSDCLMAAGYNVSDQPKEGMPQLHVALKAFWSDGYQHSRIGTTIPVELKRNENSQPVWQHLFEINTGVTWTAGYGPFNKGINEMLEMVKNEMLTEFNSKMFKNKINYITKSD